MRKKRNKATQRQAQQQPATLLTTTLLKGDAGEIRPLATRKEVAHHARVHTETVKRWQRDGLLPALVINRQTVRYYWDDVEKLLADSRVAVAA